VNRVGSFGIDLSRAEPSSVDIPAFAGSVTLQQSRAVPSPTAEPTAAPTATDPSTGSPP